VGNRSRLRRLAVGAVLGLVTAIAALPSSPAPAQGPEASNQASGAPPGWPVIVSGSGWDPSFGPVSVYSSIEDAEKSSSTPLAPASPVPSPTPNADESFSVTLVVPSLPPGPYTFVACQDCGNADGYPLARFPFTVVVPAQPTLSLSPPSGTARSTISAVGTGWNPLNGPVSVFPDASATSAPASALVAGVVPDPQGAFTASMSAPGTPNDYLFIACQRCGPESAATQTAAFTVARNVAPPAGVVVPDLVGLDARRAEELVHALHLRLRITWTGPGEQHGVVVSQSPPPRSRVPRGTRLLATARRTLAVASTDQPSRMPPAAVAGLTALIVLVAGIALWQLRSKRWLQRHIRVEPHPETFPDIAPRRMSDAPDHAVRFVRHGDRGVQTLEEIGS
jgi:hypothetical protein